MFNKKESKELRGVNEGVRLEQVAFSSAVHIKFLRHGEKENDKTKSDDDLRLTEKGREQARARAELFDMEQAVAFGSPRKRTQETAAHVMTGKISEFNGKESLEELKEKLDKDRDFGSKIGIDSRLNFYDPDTEFGKVALNAFKDGRYVKFLVQESDKLAKELGDTTGSTLSRMAASVAEIVEKYIKVAPRFDVLVNDPNKKYSKILERVLASHMGVGESFLAKIIEKTKGKVERDNFIQAIKGKGFDYTEGFDISIITKTSGTEPTITVSYSHKGEKEDEKFEFNSKVSSQIIEEIISEVE